MAAVTIESLRDVLWPYVPGAPAPALDRALRRAVVLLCERAGIWRVTLAPISLVANQHSYTLTLPADSQVHKIKRVRLSDTYTLDFMNEDDLSARDGGWETRSGRPELFHTPTPTQIRLVPTPASDQAAALKVRVELKPSRTATQLEAALFDKYEEVIVAGAAMLLNEPHLEWANPNTYATCAQTFAAGVTAAKSNAENEDQVKFQLAEYGG